MAAEEEGMGRLSLQDEQAPSTSATAEGPTVLLVIGECGTERTRA